jgi:hypothetical protein
MNNLANNAPGKDMNTAPQSPFSKGIEYADEMTAQQQFIEKKTAELKLITIKGIKDPTLATEIQADIDAANVKLAIATKQLTAFNRDHDNKYNTNTVEYTPTSIDDVRELLGNSNSWDGAILDGDPDKRGSRN